MGTISLVGNKYEREIILKFKKALIISNSKMSKTERINNKMDGDSKKSYQYGYNSAAFGYIRGYFFHLSCNPREFIYPLPKYKLTFHLSHFDNLKQLVDVLIHIFGVEHAWFVCFKLKIVRIDVWLDILVSFDIMNQSTYRSRVANRERYAAKSRTLYLGSRKSDKFSLFYEKPRKLVQKNKIAFICEEPKNLKHVIRIENRFKHKSCPISAICEYPLLANTGVFNEPHVNFFNEDSIMASSDVTNRQKKMLQPFFKDLQSAGLQYAREQVSLKRRNYKKRIEPILQKFGTDPQLNELWKHKVENQIIDNFNIDDYFNELFLSEDDINPKFIMKMTPKTRIAINNFQSPSALIGE